MQKTTNTMDEAKGYLSLIESIEKKMHEATKRVEEITNGIKTIEDYEEKREALSESIEEVLKNATMLCTIGDNLNAISGSNE